MDVRLTGQTAVIVGGANGIGRAIVEAFAAEGAATAILDLDDSSAVDLASRIQAAGGKAIARRLDVAQQEDFQRAAAKVAATLGQVDHLVYAAGAGSGKLGFPFWNLDAADWPRLLDINLTGAVRFLQAFRLPITEQRDRDRCDASVTIISSIAGQIGSQTDPPYSAAKAGLLNFMRCAAKDLASFQTRVNAICPGMVKTAINRSVWKAWQQANPAQNRLDYDAWGEQKIAAVAPLGRWQSADEIAALAIFLASPHARNITGQTLNVDGGQVMH